MPQLQDLKMNFKSAKEQFKEGLDDLRSDFDKSKEVIGESITSMCLQKEPADFSLYYCLSEALSHCERVMKEKPSRELSLVKTKLQEALFWLNEA